MSFAKRAARCLVSSSSEAFQRARFLFFIVVVDVVRRVALLLLYIVAFMVRALLALSHNC